MGFHIITRLYYGVTFPVSDNDPEFSNWAAITELLGGMIPGFDEGALEDALESDYEEIPIPGTPYSAQLIINRDSEYSHLILYDRTIEISFKGIPDDGPGGNVLQLNNPTRAESAAFTKYLRDHKITSSPQFSTIVSAGY